MADGELITAEIVANSTALEQLSRAEIDVQIATAHRFPRSVSTFQHDVLSAITLSPQIAAECRYVLPRDGKQISGPSARFAEIIASCWGNSRAGARIVNEDDRFVTAQGIFHDLQRNVAITYEVRRRITNKHGKKFSDDMVGVTANAACSIALRNAVFKGIPKAFWTHLYNEAIKHAKGDQKSLPQRRDSALEAFRQQGFRDPEIFAIADIKGKSDINLDVLLKLSGILTALSDGDVTKQDLLRQVSDTSVPAMLDNAKVQAGAKPKPDGDRSKKAPSKAEEAATTPESGQSTAATPPPMNGSPPVEDEPEELRSAEEILEVLGSICSGLTSLEDLDAVAEEYGSHRPELSFPPDRETADKLIADARKRIEGDD